MTEYRAELRVALGLKGNAVEIESAKLVRDAEAKATAIQAITQAEFEKKAKEAEANAMMPPQEFELKKVCISSHKVADLKAAFGAQ